MIQDRILNYDTPITFEPTLQFKSWHHFWRDFELSLAWRMAHLRLSDTETLTGMVEPRKVSADFLEGGCCHTVWNPFDVNPTICDESDDELEALRKHMLGEHEEDDRSSDADDKSSDSQNSRDPDADEQYVMSDSGSNDELDAGSHDSEPSELDDASTLSPTASAPSHFHNKKQDRIFSLRLPDHLGGGELIVYKDFQIYAQCPVHGRRCRKSGQGMHPLLVISVRCNASVSRVPQKNQ